MLLSTINTYFYISVKIYGHSLVTNSYYQPTISDEFCLNKLLICCLLIVSMVVIRI